MKICQLNFQLITDTSSAIRSVDDSEHEPPQQILSPKEVVKKTSLKHPDFRSASEKSEVQGATDEPLMTESDVSSIVDDEVEQRPVTKQNKEITKKTQASKVTNKVTIDKILHTLYNFMFHFNASHATGNI